MGTHALTVRYSGDATNSASTDSLQVPWSRRRQPSPRWPTPSTVKVKKGTSTVDVTVAATGFTPGGFVAAYVDGVYTSSAPLTDGKASLTVGPFDTVGAKAIEVTYFGDDHTLTGSGTTTVTVQKAAPKVTASGPTTAKVRTATPKVTVTVAADGLSPPGRWSSGSTAASHQVPLRGVGVLRLNRFYKLGRHAVEVTYPGSSLVESGKDTHVIKAVR